MDMAAASAKTKKNKTSLRDIPRIKPKAKDIEDKGLFAKGGFDVFFLIFVCLLLTFGIVMMFSASYVSAKYSAKTGYDPLYYLKRQGAFAIVGVVVMLVISKINYNVFRKFAPIIFVLSLALLALVLVAPAQVEGKEQFKRWLEIPGVHFRFQPSEVAKFGLIIFLAWSFERHRKFIEESWAATAAYLFIVVMFAGLVYLEDHLSGAILMLGIGVIMSFLGGLNWKIYAIGAAVAVIGIILIVSKPEVFLKGYMAERITSWLNKDYTDTDTRWQTNQSLFALGSGGFFGLGLGNSKQKFLYLPEPQNDFIFAIVGEELGFFRCALIILLFAALVFRGFVIAMRAKSMFERLLVLGISLQVGLQTILNILVVTDLMPNTGISLPFFSYGGTALVMQLVEMGIVLAVSRSGDRKKRAKKDA